MILSDVVKEFKGTLLYDGEFKRLDYCTVKENGPFLTFMEREKFLPALLDNTEISCVLCTPQLAEKMPVGVGVYITEEPKACFEEIHNLLADSSEYLLPNFDTEIGSNCEISPLAFIASKNVIIEDDVFVGPFAYIGEHSTIKRGCKIYNHATIGGRSFSYARKGIDEVVGLRDCGQVILDEEVEIMSYTHLARGILPTDCTYIGRRTILDAHIHVGHGAQLAERVFIAAGATLGGNCRIGRDSWIGVNACVSNRIVVGERCRVSIGAVATKDVPDDTIVTGNFAIEHSQFIRNLKKQFARD